MRACEKWSNEREKLQAGTRSNDAATVKRMQRMRSVLKLEEIRKAKKSRNNNPE